MADAPRDPPIHNPPIRLGVCVSGGGSTLQNLIDQIRARKLKAQITQVVASRPRIKAIARAEAVGIPLEKKKGGEVLPPEEKTKGTGKYKNFKVTAAQVRDIAQRKFQDLNARDVEHA